MGVQKNCATTFPGAEGSGVREESGGGRSWPGGVAGVGSRARRRVDRDSSSGCGSEGSWPGHAAEGERRCPWCVQDNEQKGSAPTQNTKASHHLVVMEHF